MSDEFSPENVKEWLEYSPTPGASNPQLAGFRIGEWRYCAHCTGRLAARGILLPRSALPIWVDASEKGACDACGKSLAKREAEAH
jgi:hypothetical protein